MKRKEYFKESLENAHEDSLGQVHHSHKQYQIGDEPHEVS